MLYPSLAPSAVRSPSHGETPTALVALQVAATEGRKEHLQCLIQRTTEPRIDGAKDPQVAPVCEKEAGII